MYKDLSLKEKAKVIREGVRLGLNFIDDILSLYDEAISYLQGGPIVSPYGQWLFKGKKKKEDTIVPSNNITMDYVDYPVLGVSDTGDTKVMIPWNDYKFRGSVVYEHPLIDNQFQLGGLAKPFSYGDIPDVRYLKGGNIFLNGEIINRIKPIEEYITPIEPPVLDNTYVVRNYPYYLLPEVLNKNKRLSDEEISNYYASDILWTMENPKHKGLNPDGTYSAYEDEAGFNFGPGLHAKSNNLDINKTYTKLELDSIASNIALNYMKLISEDLETMQDGRYAGARDTLSAGPLLTMLDIAYNVKPKNKGNMPQKWPNLTDSLINGDIERAKENTYSGSTRRQNMRNLMIVYKPLEGITVHNEALGGNLFKKGGIYIKPSHRGRFTALKKRTGHSASWFKAHGTPALKKMATFALNARHWNHKHDEGGHLFLEDGQIFKRPLDDLTGRNILTSPILPPKSYYEQFTIPELEPKKPQPLQPLEGTYGNKYSELIPMSDEIYVNNPINKGLQQDWRTHALEFAPLLAIGAGPAIGSTATWLASKPALYNLGKMTLSSEIGGRSVDLASNLFTGNTWGLNVGNVVEGITGWNPNNTMVGLFVTDATNPGYAGKEGLASLAGLFRKPKKLIISNPIDYSKWSDNMWDDAYFKAINSNNTDEVLRLRDLHFRVKTPNNKFVDLTGNPILVYHGSPRAGFKQFDSSKISLTIGGDTGKLFVKGNFSTTDLPAAIRYAHSYLDESIPQYYNRNFWQKIFTKKKPVSKVDAIPEELRLNTSKLLDELANFGIEHQRSKVMPLYINSENPMIVDFGEKPWSISPIEIPSEYRTTLYDTSIPKRTVLKFNSKEDAYKLFYKDVEKIKQETVGNTRLNTGSPYYGTEIDEPMYDYGSNILHKNFSLSFDPELTPQGEIYRMKNYKDAEVREWRRPLTTNGIADFAYSKGNDGVLMKNTIDANTHGNLENYPIDDYVFFDSRKTKLANPIVYDDNGNIISLSKRDNFRINDIRYGLIPLSGIGLYGLQNKVNRQYN